MARRPLRPLSVVVALAVAVCLYVAVAGWMLRGHVVQALAVLPAAVVTAARSDDPIQPGYRGDPMQALGLAFEHVIVATPLGPAPAWYVPGRPDTPAAVYIHGISGAREDGYRHLALLQRAGIATLLMTYRNDPGAPADPAGRYGFGLTEWPDVEAAVDLLRARGHDRVILVAESMGGAIAGQFLRRSDRATAVVAVALDSPAVDFGAVLAHLAGRARVPLPGAVAAVAVRWLRLSGPPGLGEAQVDEVFAGFDGPVFVAHGTVDSTVPALSTDAMLAKRRGLTVQLRTDADHLASYRAAPQAYAAGFAAFLGLIPAP